MKNKNDMVFIKRYYIKPTDENFKECYELTNAARILRNKCLYYIRQHYTSTGTLYKMIDGKKQYLFNYTHLYHTFKNSDAFRTEFHPEINKKIATKALKSVFIQVNTDFSNFYAAVKSYNKNPSKFLGRPKIPSYSKSCSIIRFNKEALSFKKKGFIGLSMTNLSLELCSLTRQDVVDVSITPSTCGFYINVSYNAGPVKPVLKKNECTRICAIDLGLNNMATLTSNDPNVNSIIINGRPVKSINQYYNKMLAKFRSELPNGIYTSNKIQKLTQKRNNKISDYMHCSAKTIVEHMVSNDIQCLVVGSNKHWKQSINIGRRNNQNFVSVPYYKFKQMLQYLCKKNGILYIEREESYTSKCSFLDLEDISKKEEYLGKRKTRGCFVSSNGTKINADVNGSYNILRKEFGNDYFRDIGEYSSTHIIKRSL